MQRFIPTVGYLACFVVIAAGRANAIQPDAFGKHVIDAEFAGGYQVSVADIDSDGKPDVIALSTTPSQLVWYKNPTWERNTITTKTNGNIDVAPHDIDGDGDPDLALAYEFSLQNSTSGGDLAWLECPADPMKTEDWTIHPIGAIPTSHRIRWAALDRNGGTFKWLINLPIIGTGAKPPEYSGGVSFVAFQPPSSPSKTASPWSTIEIDSRLEMAHGVRVVQWDNDAPEEILTASFDGVHLFDLDQATQKFTKRQLGEGHAGQRPGQGSSEVALGVLASQQMRLVATVEPWHGNEVVVYEIGTPTTMGEERVVIDNALTDGHALVCVDIDKDGNDEIVAGGRGGDKALCIYQFAAENAEWERTLIDAGNIGAAGLFVADINQDGYMDIVAIGTATHNVVLYENTTGR